MKRGDIVTIALQGDYGKPRPALILQSDFFNLIPSVTVAPITSELRDAPLFRIHIEPSVSNGLDKTSEIMMDKIQTLAREKVGRVIGQLHDDEMRQVNRSIMVFLGIV